MSAGVGAAPMVAPGRAIRSAADSLNAVEHVQFIWLGHNYCWYDDGWNGPGWYWCGPIHDVQALAGAAATAGIIGMVDIPAAGRVGGHPGGGGGHPGGGGGHPGGGGGHPGGGGGHPGGGGGHPAAVGAVVIPVAVVRAADIPAVEAAAAVIPVVVAAAAAAGSISLTDASSKG